MKYLNTKEELLNENNSDESTKKILKTGLMSVVNTSHLVSSQILSNMNDFLDNLNVEELSNEVGNIIDILGHGVFGTVFELDNGKALKLTFDYREAPFLFEYGLNNKVNGIVKVDNVFKIKFGDIFAYLIVRSQLDFIEDANLVKGVISDLKRNGVNDKMLNRYKNSSSEEYSIFLALKAMYDLDPNWRGTHYKNIAKQNGEFVLYDGFSKNIKLSDSEIPFLDLELDINEAMVNKRTLDQNKRVRDMMKGIDIGDRVSKQEFPNQVAFHNANDVHIQSYEEYMNEPFETNQNVKDFKPNK